jgi:hypothetical protein
MAERTNPNYVQLMKTIVEYSQSPLVDVAKAEWYITAYYKEQNGVTCLCGHPECMYVYIIKNYNNNNTLAPIGSSCMQYFEWDGQNQVILKAYEKWHMKKYNNPGGQYDQMEFHEVIKDAEYIRLIDKYGIKKEQEKLVLYAKAVWIFNPPPLIIPVKPPSLPPPPAPPRQECQKCVEQRKKGFKKCYDCFTQKSPKPVCLKCAEQKKKGYSRCYSCYKESL